MRALKLAEGGKRCALTGTPMKKHGGSDIWGILNYLRPDVFTSFWRMASTYFDIEDNGYGKTVKELKPDMADAFFRMLQPYVLRRTKAEAVPWLPPKFYIPVRCVMGERQRKQYEDIEKRGATSFGNIEVTTTGVLAEFIRLKQYANAYCKMDKTGAMVPVESCKVEAMLEKMDEAGMFDEGSDKKQLVFSQSRQMIEYVADVLRKKGLKTDIISGKINKSADRKRIKDDFQNGDTRVLCIVTTAGGVSLTLDMADEVHLLDEMWSPDEDAQAEDRAHRVSRIHQVTVFIYRTEGTIDSYVQDVKEAKLVTHQFILDIRKRIVEKWGK
jgi:SNF2 family DNA or RNA helicase